MTLSAAAANQTIGQQTASRSRPQRWMFVILAAAILAVVLVAFAPTLYLRSRVGPMDVALQHADLPLHLVVHGIALTAWFSLLLIQPWLIAVGNRRLHMRLGLFGVVAAVGVVATGIYTLVQFV